MDRFLKEAKEGSQTAFATIVRQYHNLMHDLVNRYTDGNDREDLWQEAMIALFTAVQSYDASQAQVTFGLYAKVCMRNRLISQIRKRRVITEELEGNESEEIGLWSEDKSVEDPERDFIERERVRELFRDMEALLSPFEKQVLMLHLAEIPHSEIARRLGVESKAVDNAVYRCKTKLKRAR
jgi:RNA polymerase sporulation-specific sigma factor